MLAAHLSRLAQRRPARYAAMDPTHLQALQNYLSLMTRANDLPGITHELTRRQVIPGDLSADVMHALRNPADPADLAMSADKLADAGLSGKTPTPGRAYRGFDAPHAQSNLLDALFYHLHGLAQQGQAAQKDPRHPILRDFAVRPFPEYSTEPSDRTRIVEGATSSLHRILRAMPQDHPLRAPIASLAGYHGAGDIAPGQHEDMLRRAYDLSHQAEILGQQHGGGYTSQENTLGDLDWTGRHSRQEAAHGISRLIDHLRGVRLARRK